MLANKERLRSLEVEEGLEGSPDKNLYTRRQFWAMLPNEGSLQTKRDAQTGGGDGTGGYTRQEFVHQTIILG